VTSKDRPSAPRRGRVRRTTSRPEPSGSKGLSPSLLALARRTKAKALADLLNGRNLPLAPLGAACLLADRAEIRFEQPRPLAVVPLEVEARIKVSGARLAVKGTRLSSSGARIGVMIDQGPLPSGGRAEEGPGLSILGPGVTSSNLQLTAGDHTLCAQLIDDLGLWLPAFEVIAVKAR
jgi:hypothetical protein